METADNQQQSFLSEEQEIQEAIQRIKEGYQLVDQLKVLELYELKDKISKKNHNRK